MVQTRAVISLGPGEIDSGGRARLKAATTALAGQRPEVTVVAAVLVPGKTEPPSLISAAERLIAGGVNVTRTNRLSPRAGAPVVCVYPQGTVHSHLDAGAGEAFVERVLVAGERLPGHTFRPGE